MKEDFDRFMAMVASASPTKENGMEIDLGSRAERGRKPARSFS